MTFSAAHPVIAVKPIKAHPSRRGTIRVAAMLPVELVFSGASGGAIPARSVDIGMGGMCVQTGSMIDASAIRAVRVSLGDTRVEIGIRSHWSLEFGGNGGPASGLVFESVNEEVRASLWNYIQRRGHDLGMFLSSCIGLDQLNFEEAFELALATRIRQIPAGDLVYRGGDEERSAAICALMEGSVLLEPANGRFNQQISTVGPRELFGGLSVVAGCVPFERAVAVEDSTVLEFSGYGVENLLNTKSYLGVALLRASSFHWMRRFAEVLDRTLTD